jgi:multidrug efflux pump subunit AcrB
MLALIRIALARPYTFIVLAMLIMIFGVMSWIKTPTDIFPNIDIPVITVVWTYNGLPPDDMSGRIVYYFERGLSAQTNDIEHIESQSLPGYGIVKIFFQKNVNINTALPQVSAGADTVLKQLPAGSTPPNVLIFNASSVPILQLALSGKEFSQALLFDYGNNFIRPQLATVPGAAVPTPYGGQVRQIQIDLDQHKLQSYGLSSQDVTEALAAQNLITPVGTEKIGKFEYIVNLNDAPRKVAALNDLPIKKVNGTVVYIRDVAYVRDGAPPQANLVRVDGRHAVLMTILKAGSASTLDVINGAKKQLPLIKETLPPTLQISPVGDQSVFVTAAVSAVIKEGVIAAALTGLMILVFLGSWRSTLIITISIPLAILFSVTLLSLIGQTINVMTLGGLALAVGILVDDATVTIENINYHLEQGKPIRDAIMDGSKQIVVPATVSLLCICVVFVPMFALSGVAGFLFRPLAEAVIFAMMGSYLLSRTLVPTLANYLLANRSYHPEPDTEITTPHPHPQPSSGSNVFVRFQSKFEARFEAIRDGYHDLLKLAMGSRRAFSIGFLAMVLVSFGLLPFLGRNFFPPIGGSEIKLHVRTQTGTRIEETARLCDQIERSIRNVIPASDLDRIVDNIGLSPSGVNLAYGNSGMIGVEDADILISLRRDHHGEVADLVDTLRDRLPHEFPGTSFAFLPADMISQILNFGLPAPIDIQVVGNDIAGNRVYVGQLLKRIKQVTGIADARVQQPFNAPTLNVDVDRSMAAEVGLTERDAVNAMQDTLASSFQTAPTFWLNPKSGVTYPLVVQTPQYRIDTVGDLNNIPITSKGSFQLLGGLAKISRAPSSAVVSHYNVRPAIDIYATTHGRDLGAIASDIREILKDAAKEAPRGSTVTLRGQVTTMTTAYSELLAGLAFAVVFIYLLIVVNFQSWLDPFVIITGLPAALAGIVWMLFATGTTLSVPALTGAIMCMGVATANSILVVSFARERMDAGADGITAALDSGFTRFRPVLMTALAMIIGMAPMALSTDQNAPLGRAVIGGLLWATVATLFFVPVVFSLVHGKPQRASRPQDGGALPEDISHA